jgi:hypothetical protein
MHWITKRLYDQTNGSQRMHPIYALGKQQTRPGAIVSLPIVVRAQFGGEDPCSETRHTLVVNAPGALIAMFLRVLRGQRLELGNLISGKEQSCCVVYIGGRKSNKTEVGVEFLEPAPHFWNISFPPADWKPPRD